MLAWPSTASTSGSSLSIVRVSVVRRRALSRSISIVSPKQQAALWAWHHAAKALAKKLRSAVGSHVQFAVGEFGLGSADTTRPWYFDEKTFLRPDGKMDDGARQTRRMFYNGFLNALSSGLENVERVSFWTVAQYDFLGVCGNDVFRDEELRSAVRNYNTEAI